MVEPYGVYMNSGLYQLVDNLEAIFERLKLNLPEISRPFYKKLSIDELRGVLLYGLRGVGKTTFLLKKIQNKNFLYFSADNPTISNFPLFDIVEAIFRRGYDGVVIDEVHFANKWSLHIKSLFDAHPNKIIWISDSSNLTLRKSVADLSRRFVQYKIPLMSFREYIFLASGLFFDEIDVFNNLDRTFLCSINKINVLKLFNEYLSFGTRPIFIEGVYCLRLKSLLEKTIYSDIPFYVSSISDNHLRLLNAIIGHLLLSPIPTINISGMCNEWGIGKEKLYDLLYVMEHSELINIVRQKNKHNFLKGSKVFLSDPTYYNCFKGNIGSLREAFFVTSVKEKYTINASYDETVCDYLVNDIAIEIGGKNKKSKHADYVVSDDLEIPVGKRLPLWIFGFLY